MTTKTKLSFHVSNLDPLCTILRITLRWTVSGGIQLFSQATFSPPINNILEFPDDHGNNAIYTLLGNQNIQTGDTFVGTLEQGVSYGPDDPIVYSNTIDISFTATVPVTNTPNTPTISATTEATTSKNPIVIITIDNIDVNSTDYELGMDVKRNNIFVTDSTNSFNLDQTVCLILDKIPSKPFNTNTLHFPFISDGFLKVGDQLTFYATLKINSNPANQSNPSFIKGTIQTFSYIVDNPKPPKPDQPTAVPVVSLYQD